jgi:hypothetical protein
MRNSRKRWFWDCRRNRQPDDQSRASGSVAESHPPTPGSRVHQVCIFDTLDHRTDSASLSQNPESVHAVGSYMYNMVMGVYILNIASSINAQRHSIKSTLRNSHVPLELEL